MPRSAPIYDGSHNINHRGGYSNEKIAAYAKEKDERNAAYYAPEAEAQRREAEAQRKQIEEAEAARSANIWYRHGSGNKKIAAYAREREERLAAYYALEADAQRRKAEAQIRKAEEAEAMRRANGG